MLQNFNCLLNLLTTVDKYQKYENYRFNNKKKKINRKKKTTSLKK